MLFKLSFKNIKKSFKDYSIYFFTLVFAVAMFYMFNSIDAQTSTLNLTESKKELIQAIMTIINYISVFVSITLGFLIIYSNNFLIKRRKKEIGLYFTLGMDKKKVSIMITIETIIIGIISLAVGIFIGYFLSQFISLITAYLFEVDMTGFKFIFSSTALLKTLLYFGIIFILVIIFNIFVLSRYKLIDLLTASKKNEKVKFRNKYVIIITFMMAIITLGYAYYLLFQHKLFMMDSQTLIMIVLGAIGTFLLFFSMSGFIVKVFEHIKKIYYKDLNMFTLKQINSKINTTVVSTSIICLMLLLTIGIISGAMSMASVFNNDINKNNLVDYSVILEMENKNIISNSKELQQLNKTYSQEELKKYTEENVLLHYYIDENLNVSSLMSKKEKQEIEKEYGSNLSFDFKVPMITESEYKKLMNLTNQEYINIKDNEFLILCNLDMAINAYQPNYKAKKSININNNKLTPASDQIIETGIMNSNSNGNDGVIVVSDQVVDNLKLSSAVFIGNFIKTSNPEQTDKDFYNYLTHNILDNNFQYRTKVAMQDASIGLKAMLLFIGLYLGLTFAITSATILAIGQLSEASDNKNRYKILKQLGADEKIINKSLFIQIAVPFLFPLVVALIHSYFGLKEINNLLTAMGQVDLTSNIVSTALFIVILYGGYFMATYLCSKNIIKE